MRETRIETRLGPDELAMLDVLRRRLGTTRGGALRQAMLAEAARRRIVMPDLPPAPGRARE